MLSWRSFRLKEKESHPAPLASDTGINMEDVELGGFFCSALPAPQQSLVHPRQHDLLFTTALGLPCLGLLIVGYTYTFVP